MSDPIAEQVVSSELTPEQAGAITQYNNLSAEDRQKVNAEVVDIQAKVAEGLLSSNGWQILKTLYQLTMQRVLLTSQFTVPVLHLRGQIEPLLQDPVGFDKSFKTLCADLMNLTHLVRQLGAKHLERDGEPTANDVPVIVELADEYNEVLNIMDTAADPLQKSLQDIIFKECAVLFAPAAEAEPEV